jgi:hypothetical protein
VFATASGKPKNNVRTMLGRVVAPANERRAARGSVELPPVVSHTLRRTYIRLMLEAGAPLHYVMDQVGHEDSKPTLEIYAHVQKRLTRPQVKRAFEALLAGKDLGSPDIPAEARRRCPVKPPEARKSAPMERSKRPVGPNSGPQPQYQLPEDDVKTPSSQAKSPGFPGLFGMGTAGLEPATSRV